MDDKLPLILEVILAQILLMALSIRRQTKRKQTIKDKAMRINREMREFDQRVSQTKSGLIENQQDTPRDSTPRDSTPRDIELKSM